MNDFVPWLFVALQIIPLIVALRWMIDFIYEVIRAPKDEPQARDEATFGRGGEGAGARGPGQPEGQSYREPPAAFSPARADYYRILQVEPVAPQPAIHAAYRRLALQFHPDTNLSPEALRRMQEINEAFRVLRDPARRAEYDEQG